MVAVMREHQDDEEAAVPAAKNGLATWLDRGRVLAERRRRAAGMRLAQRWAAFGAEAPDNHGRDRDKRGAVMTVITEMVRRGEDWSNGEIARRCGVPQELVARLRPKLVARARPICPSPAIMGSRAAAGSNGHLSLAAAGSSSRPAMPPPPPPPPAGELI